MPPHLSGAEELLARRCQTLLGEVLVGEKAGENRKVGKAHVATGAAFCWWSCPFPRPLNSILRRWTTSLQFLSGLPFPVPALQHGTLDLDFSCQTQLSPAAFQPHGPLVSGTGSGHGPPQHLPQTEFFSGGFRT